MTPDNDDQISHGEWECVPFDEEDSDNFTTPGWFARNMATGQTRIIHHSRWNFTMTPERFAWLVENDFRAPGYGGPWVNATIDAAIHRAQQERAA